MDKSKLILIMIIKLVRKKENSKAMFLCKFYRIIVNLYKINNKRIMFRH